MMEYSVNRLAKISGLTTRTLRYYDEIGLLIPARISSNGYRIYSAAEVDLLQQILFYRQLGFQLTEIKDIIYALDYDKTKALENHLSSLIDKRKQIDMMINNLRKTISAAKGEISMTDKEKFEGFKQKLIEDNEDNYGKEIREKYGDSVVDESNKRVKGMSEEDWNQAQSLSEEINKTLKEAFDSGDPKSETAQKACELHKEWLCMFWKKGMYNKEIHKAMGEMYVSDERFTAYYDKISKGVTAFFKEALDYYCR